MSNATATSLRHPSYDVSVGDATASTLLSYFLLRVIQWIVTSGVLIILGRAFFVFAVSGMVAILMTGTTARASKRGFNDKQPIISKKHV